VAIRPHSPAAPFMPRLAFQFAAHHEEAFARFTAASALLKERVRLRPNWAEGHYFRGYALHFALSLPLKLPPEYADEALVEFKEAVRLRPDWKSARLHLFNALQRKGLHEEAIAIHRENVGLYPEDATFRFQLAGELALSKLLDEAIVQYKEAIRL